MIRRPMRSTLSPLPVLFCSVVKTIFCCMCALLIWLNGPKGNRLRPVMNPHLRNAHDRSCDSFFGEETFRQTAAVLACPDPGFDVCDWLHASSAVQGYRRTRWRDPEHASPVGRYFSRTVNHPFETAQIEFAQR